MNFPTKELVPFQMKTIHGFIDAAGEPWFLLREVCLAADMKNNPHIKDRINPKDMLSKQTPTAGGNQDMVYVNESGFYAAIGGSRKTKAMELCRALLAEIPNLRKPSQNLLETVKALTERIEKLETGRKPLALAAALPQMTPEAECNRIISGYCREYGFDYSACWNTSYKDLYYICHHNVFKIAKEKGISKLDVVRAKGWGKELLELVKQRYEEG